jgi:hypothetical protein
MAAGKRNHQVGCAGRKTALVWALQHRAPGAAVQSGMRRPPHSTLTLTLASKLLMSAQVYSTVYYIVCVRMTPHTGAPAARL